MKIRTLDSSSALAAALILGAVALGACQPGSAVTARQNSDENNSAAGNNTATGNNAATGELEGTPFIPPADTGNASANNTATQPMPDIPGLGADPDAAPIPVGFLNGSWRVATDDAEDAPVVYFDFVHDEGASTATCDFLMSLGLGPNFDGKIGKCAEVTWEGDTLTVRFNPTEDIEDEWTLTTTTRVDDDRFEAKITKLKDAQFSAPVLVERRLPNPDSDNVRPSQ